MSILVYQYTCMRVVSRVIRITLYKETRTLKGLDVSSKHHKYCSTRIDTVTDRRACIIRSQRCRFIHTTNSVPMAVRIFEGKEHAALYSQYRPTYPDILYDTITKYYEDGRGPTCNFDMAVDVGCGSGQSTRPLTKYFQQVTGTDVSAEQIANTNTDDKSKLTFRVGAGEDLSFLDDDSVDLVTVAQAFHWFDAEKFYKEVTRVLKPGGVVAIYGYGKVQVDNNEGQQLFYQFHTDLLGPYWDKGRRHVDNMYTDFQLPFPGWQRLVGEELVIRRTMPVDGYIGYLSTFSPWRKYLKEHPGSDYLQRMRERLLELYSTQSGIDSPIMNVSWPIFLLIGRKAT